MPLTFDPEIAAALAPMAEIALFMGLPEEAGGGTRTPDPIITSASDVSLVGVSRGQFAVNSGDSGSS
jgi:hypothetical protein